MMDKRAELGNSSAGYWQEHYAAGGNSGSGSYGDLADFKAAVLNAFVLESGAKTFLELGCGDGNQLSLIQYPRYIGLDVAERALAICRERFASDSTKTFAFSGLFFEFHPDFKADVTLSLDVIYHLIEDDVYERYMARLFDSAVKWVVIYAPDRSDDEYDAAVGHPSVRWRRFSEWIRMNRTEWKLHRHVPNDHPHGSSAEFFIYCR